ncbi:hypothetical protein SASPL_123865 [Salvia splendens]|uniref:Uncharacterized protein ycf33 n=1 Tax=Salvia splendens TaxID=180675 RepID=A0A8X8XQN7_SALSN|nr:uncharacterized protein LOC121743016 [Salvia splendens]KAG6416435.1 hypothetical protein SASPL_123865 [Salvia splendens]
MNTIRVELLHLNPLNLRNRATNPPIKPRLNLTIPFSNHAKHSTRGRVDLIPKLSASDKEEAVSSAGGVALSEANSRIAVLAALSVGVAVFVMGFSDERALALGPEGPLMEDFWDNMRRYALYALTVSTGALWVLLEPIVELLKNPISALLLIFIFGGSFFILSQVVTAMIGLSDFSYDYSN